MAFSMRFAPHVLLHSLLTTYCIVKSCRTLKCIRDQHACCHTRGVFTPILAHRPIDSLTYLLTLSSAKLLEMFRCRRLSTILISPPWLPLSRTTPQNQANNKDPPQSDQQTNPQRESISQDIHHATASRTCWRGCLSRWRM
eukprot:SAG31_NODE_3616_length_4066_cov_1.641543_5_plen_141_part_00